MGVRWKNTGTNSFISTELPIEVCMDLGFLDFPSGLVLFGRRVADSGMVCAYTQLIFIRITIKLWYDGFRY